MSVERDKGSLNFKITLDYYRSSLFQRVLEKVIL